MLKPTCDDAVAIDEQHRVGLVQKLEREAAQHLQYHVGYEVEVATMQKRVGQQTPQLRFLSRMIDERTPEQQVLHALKVTTRVPVVGHVDRDLHNGEEHEAEGWRKVAEDFFGSFFYAK